ncbi:PRD domain-containing protein [Streptococcus sp. NLN64]|uniref:BglG family transcription antiterminator n=1 Tax=Streptococcus sp. NLN64 TaxID=2822799 RepID=UPI0018CBE988|nr:PRD domain-containing protein [Streptococcus sp. NLN64]MBG9367693.1 BglG family transcription antiterminator [Streptococcus sp. NLN64]
MLSKKEVRLLDHLTQNPSQYYSSKELAELLGVSDRTARKYLQNLATSLENSGGKLESKQGKGYQLLIERPLEFQVFWQEELSRRKQGLDLNPLEEAEDRERYLLHKLFFEEGELALEDLQQEMFIARTTLQTIVAEIRKLLAAYQLKLVVQKGRVRVEGSEVSSRNFMMDYFFGQESQHLSYGLVENEILEDISFSSLLTIVIDQCRAAGLRISDFVMKNLVLHIALLLQRVKQGASLKDFPLAPQLESSRELEVAQRILSRVEDQFGVVLAPEEANYIALHLKVKLPDDRNQFHSGQEKLLAHLTQVLEILSQESGLNLVQDSQLVKGILAHLQPLLTRLENGMTMGNPLLETIQADYQEVLELTKKAFSNLSELQGFQVSDDEWAYLTLHVLAAIERYQSEDKTRVLVVCSTGVGSALMLKNRLEKEFARDLEIVDVLSYYEITEDRLEGIDLIVSSVSLSNLVFLTPVVTVSVFLSDQDIKKIRSQLQRVSLPSRESGKNRWLTLSQARLIATSLFSPDRFLVFDTADRDFILEELIASLDEGFKKKELEEFKEQVDLRESYSSVVFGEALAFPHPAKPLTYTEQVAVAVVQDKVEWEAGKGVSFVFLLSPSTGPNPNFKYVSPSLVGFVQDPTLQEKLLADPTYEQLLEIMIPLIQAQG